jgi:hypothetical protein
MRLPSVSSRQIIRAPRAVGFTEAPDRGKDIPRGTLLAILDQASLSKDEFVGLSAVSPRRRMWVPPAPDAWTLRKVIDSSWAAERLLLFTDAELCSAPALFFFFDFYSLDEGFELLGAQNPRGRNENG